MAASASTQPSPNRANFAGLLELFATSDRRPVRAADWSQNQAEDDIASLSYDRALRMHTRTQPVQLASPTAAETPPAADSTPTADAPPDPRKSASVTIRLSQNELELLHARATESGLNVSAYLRSCIFDVEDLRAQVKHTLRELRTANVSTDTPLHPRWYHIFFPRRPALQRSAQA